MIDLTGKTFSRLTVLTRASDKNAQAMWLCRCDCGVNLEVIGHNLRRGNTKSCGCLRRESSRRRLKRENHWHFTHGLSKTPTHNVWRGMLNRCYRKSHKHYRYYGGRGITVCERWRKDFMAFLQDMGERPIGKTIDRIDSNGIYEPTNCRWATMFEQANNRRENIRIEWQGRSQTLSEWAKEFGLARTTLYRRYARGFPLERLMDPKKFRA